MYRSKWMSCPHAGAAHLPQPLQAEQNHFSKVEAHTPAQPLRKRTKKPTKQAQAPAGQSTECRMSQSHTRISVCSWRKSTPTCPFDRRTETPFQSLTLTIGVPSGRLGKVETSIFVVKARIYMVKVDSIILILYYGRTIFMMLALEQSAEKWPFSAGGRGRSTGPSPLESSHFLHTRHWWKAKRHL